MSWACDRRAGDSTKVLTTYTRGKHLLSGAPQCSKKLFSPLKLEPELRADFMAEAEASHSPASQVLRELMRKFVQRQREARKYDAFLRAKVADAREQIRADA